MNENEKEQNQQPEKPALDDKRKSALLRYVAVLFAVAFIFVLFSLITQMRDSKSTISELSQSSSSALQKAEQLQDTNRQLETDNAHLEGRIEELEKQLASLEQELDESQQALDEKEEDLQQLTEEMAELQEAADNAEEIQAAYELLLRAEQDPTLLAELEDDLQYFGDYAVKFYENLRKKGE